MSNSDVDQSNAAMMPILISLLRSEEESCRETALRILSEIAVQADEYLKLMHERVSLFELIDALQAEKKLLKEYIGAIDQNKERTTSSIAVGLGISF